jgi:toxin ParE1/3/4
MARYRLTASAQADIIDVLARTEAQFGEAARLRYERLIVTGIRDIAGDPARPGTLEREELGANARTWHLRGSRERARTASGIVKRPRHLLLFRTEADGMTVIGRILHDAMELDRHLPTERDWLS